MSVHGKPLFASDSFALLAGDWQFLECAGGCMHAHGFRLDRNLHSFRAPPLARAFAAYGSFSAPLPQVIAAYGSSLIPEVP